MNMQEKAKEREHQLKMMKEKCGSDLQLKKYDMESEEMKKEHEQAMEAGTNTIARIEQEANEEKERFEKEHEERQKHLEEARHKIRQLHDQQFDEMSKKHTEAMERHKEHGDAMIAILDAEWKELMKIQDEQRERLEKEYAERQKDLEKRESEMKQLHQQQIDEMNKKYKEAEERHKEHGDAMIAILGAEREQMMKIQDEQRERLEKVIQNSWRNYEEKMRILNKQLEDIEYIHRKVMKGYRAEQNYLETQKNALCDLRCNFIRKEIDVVLELRRTINDYTANSQFNSRMDDNKRMVDRTLRYITDIKGINDRLGTITDEALRKRELDFLSFTLIELNKHAEQARQTAEVDMNSIGANLAEQNLIQVAKGDRCKKVIEDIIKQEDELEKIFENMPKADNAIAAVADMLHDDEETDREGRVGRMNMESRAKEREHELKMMKEKCDRDLQMKKYEIESKKIKNDLERELQRMNDEAEREKRQMQNKQLQRIANETDKTNKMMLDMKKQADAAAEKALKEDNEMYERNRQEMIRMNEERRKEHERAMEAEKNTIDRIKQETSDERKQSEKEYKERQKHLEKRENEMKQLHQQQIDEMNKKYKEAEERRKEHGDAMIAILDAEREQMMKIQDEQKGRLKEIMQNSERSYKEKMAILDKQNDDIKETHQKVMEGYRAERKFLESQKSALEQLERDTIIKEIQFVSDLTTNISGHNSNSQFNSRMDNNKRMADRTLRYITDVKTINVKLGRITNETAKKRELDRLGFTLIELNKHAEQARQTAEVDMNSIRANLREQNLIQEILQEAHDIHQIIVENHVDAQNMDINSDESKKMIGDIINQADKLKKRFENMPRATNAIAAVTNMIYTRVNQSERSISQQLEHITIGWQSTSNNQRNPHQLQIEQNEETAPIDP
ncbi:hypothetical protein WR25_11935 [Diploscapter pachys]|uniref:Uncharacterized protein n=1 Tax=Diploscapter pachys TaxID=2018661 RepID=A0A2A2LTX2_9BILA|nr:hypothetical protein WR25_11935 [Diploscapter pachys]